MARRENLLLQERLIIPFDHPSTAASLTWSTWKVPTGKSFRIDRVIYINPTGLATDASNYFTGVLKNGATTISTLLNTNSSGGAALTANTFISGVLSATDANNVLAAASVLTFVSTKTGTQTLPAGRLLIEGRLL